MYLYYSIILQFKKNISLGLSYFFIYSILLTNNVYTYIHILIIYVKYTGDFLSFSFKLYIYSNEVFRDSRSIPKGDFSKCLNYVRQL